MSHLKKEELEEEEGEDDLGAQGDSAEPHPRKFKLGRFQFPLGAAQGSWIVNTCGALRPKRCPIPEFKRELGGRRGECI